MTLSCTLPQTRRNKLSTMLTQTVHVAYNTFTDESQHVISNNDTNQALYPEEAPIHSASFCSSLVYNWISGFIWRVFKQGTVDTSTSWRCPREETTDINGKRLYTLWKDEVHCSDLQRASLGRVLFRFVRNEMIVAIIANIFGSAFALLIPALFLRAFIDYVHDPGTNVGYGMGLTVGLLCSDIGRTMMIMQHYRMGYLMGIRARSGLMYVIFNKILKLRSLNGKASGEFVNIFANDCQRVFEFCWLAPMLFGGIFAAVASTVYCVLYIGWWTLLGAAILGLYYPFQPFLVNIMEYIRKRTVTITDRRIRLLTEILICIKLIKFHAWERSFVEKVAALRLLERTWLRRAAYVHTINVATTPLTPIFAAIATILALVLTGHGISASQAFVLIAVYNATQTRVLYIPQMVRIWSETIIGLKRAKDILGMEEMDIASIASQMDDPSTVIQIQNATFAWDIITHGQPQKINLNNFPPQHGEQSGVRSKLQQSLAMENETNTCSSIKSASGKQIYNAAFSLDIDQTAQESNILLEDASSSEEGKQSILLETETRRYSDDITSKTSEIKSVCLENIGGFTVVLFDINLEIPKAKLCAICGPTGSGKSSLISGLLGQMRRVRGEVAISGRVCYVPQQAWILNATVRDNILFGREYVEQRYMQVIDMCSLQADLTTFIAGDLTEVGERGISLSGGQRQRVSLARAVYSDRDVMLLDDPLSAVDANVGRHLFERCILQCMAEEKTVVLVTHQLQYINRCDHIAFMKDGRIVECGSHDELMAAKGAYAGLIQTYHASLVKEVDVMKATEVPDILTSAEMPRCSHTSQLEVPIVHDGKIIEKEDLESGAVTWSTYKTYFKAAGGVFVFLITLLCFMLPSATSVFNNWWLSHWINRGGNIASIGSDANSFIFPLVYGLTGVAITLLICIRGILFTTVTLRASSNLHNHLFTKLMRCPMNFFDVTPIGRTLNRFSKDMDQIDVSLPLRGEEFLQRLSMLIGAFVMISIALPWFLIGVVPAGAVFIFLWIVARVVMRELKRLDNVSRSPVFSHVTTSVQGLHSIHAYNKEIEFEERFKELVDTNAVAVLLYFFSLQWLTLRLLLLTTIFTVLTAIVVVLTKGSVPESLAALGLFYVIEMNSLFRLIITDACETEAYLTSVERIGCYLKNAPEEAPSFLADRRPPESWPHLGAIQIRDYNLRYRPGLPLVLKRINCDIKPSEKVGLVGRTGSGKSTLGSALFRLVEPESGSITIDGVDISTIGLDDLRSKLSIIPQDPMLFVGTIRYNLDPFNEHDDVNAVWTALERCHMKDVITRLDNGLESDVVENGENFSVGERQLLCLARALLRHSKILVLDEATAAVDTETDAKIQQTISEAFSDCTVLTIAHRLNTVLQCDRILVLDQGEIKEFDTPDALLQNNQSMLYKMLNSRKTSLI